MTKRNALPAEAIEALEELSRISAGRPYAPAHALLSHCGLIEIRTGRFGAYARITEAGREHLARMARRGSRAAPKPRGPGGIRGTHTDPGTAGGARQAGHEQPGGGSFRGAAPRTSRTAAKQAKPVVSPRR